MPTRFYTVKNGVAIPYLREGSCNGCGECCGSKNTITYGVHTQLPSRSHLRDHVVDADWTHGDWSEWEGYTIFWSQGLWWFFKSFISSEAPNLCPAYDSLHHMCNQWNDPDLFPAICRYWPFRQEDLEPFPKCGFKFELAPVAAANPDRSAEELKNGLGNYLTGGDQ